jgi:hypothetical protein
MLYIDFSDQKPVDLDFLFYFLKCFLLLFNAEVKSCLICLSFFFLSFFSMLDKQAVVYYEKLGNIQI